MRVPRASLAKAAHVFRNLRFRIAASSGSRRRRGARVNPSFRLGRIFGIPFGVNWSWLVVVALITWTLGSGVFPAQNPGLSRGTYYTMAVVAALLFFISLAAWGNLPDEADGVVAWLGYINLFLLAFNLLPALPLDGGRILRSLLWRVKGDFGWATQIAAATGRVFGFLMIGGGIALLVFEGVFSGAWLAFIGWFLLQASTSELRYLVVQEALIGLRVHNLMTRDPVTVTSDQTLGEVVDQVAAHRHTTYPVVEDGKVVGLLPFGNLASVARTHWDEYRVRDCMLSMDKVPTLGPEEEALTTLAELQESPVNRALVLEDGRLAGLLSISDIAHAIEIRRPLRLKRS